MSHLLHHAPDLRLPAAPVALRREDRIAVTGGHCPTSGAWVPESTPSAPIVLRRGEVMPPLDGRAVQWHYTPAPSPWLAKRSPTKEIRL